MHDNYIQSEKSRKRIRGNARKVNTNQSKMKGKTQVLTPTVNEINFPIERQTCSNWAIQ